MELSASMMCAKYDCLRDEVKELDAAGVDSFHIDIMDGRFVSNFGMGLQDIQCIRRHTEKPLEAHMMVCDVEPYLEILSKTGVNRIYIHPESCYHPFSTLWKIREMNIQPGIVVDPGTSVETIKELLNVVDKVIVMAVNPGRAGQAYLPYIEEKVDRLIELKDKYNFSILWDGACVKERIVQFEPKGVDAFVLGTGLLFGHKETYAESIKKIRNFV